nr:unnamed protein product [Digitaria exilis]
MPGRWVAAAQAAAQSSARRPAKQWQHGGNSQACEHQHTERKLAHALARTETAGARLATCSHRHGGHDSEQQRRRKRFEGSPEVEDFMEKVLTEGIEQRRPDVDEFRRRPRRKGETTVKRGKGLPALASHGIGAWHGHNRLAGGNRPAPRNPHLQSKCSSVLSPQLPSRSLCNIKIESAPSLGPHHCCCRRLQFLAHHSPAPPCASTRPHVAIDDVDDVRRQVDDSPLIQKNTHCGEAEGELAAEVVVGDGGVPCLGHALGPRHRLDGETEDDLPHHADRHCLLQGLFAGERSSRVGWQRISQEQRRGRLGIVFLRASSADLTAGKPPLRGVPASAPLSLAAAAIPASQEADVAVWRDGASPLAPAAATVIGLLSSFDVVAFLASHPAGTAAALSTPAGDVVAHEPSLVREVEPHTR